MAKWLAAPFESAVVRGDEGLSKKLVQAGADIGEVSLHEAVQGGNAAIVELLLEQGEFDLDEDEGHLGTPLHVAAEGDNVDIARLLLCEGAYVDAEDGMNTTPLIRAMHKGHLATAEVLLTIGADLTYRVLEFDMSPLDVAATVDHDNFVRLLIKHGADVNASSSNGCTALHFAAEKNNVAAIHVLVGAGADLHAGHDKPLHCAAGSGCLTGRVCPEAALALLNLGADVNAQSRDGETALHEAASNAGKPGSVEVVDLLLRWGADEAIVSSRGKTAAEMVGTDRRSVFVGLPDHVERVRSYERVRTLLERAPADRTWRRRGLLVLCRAFPDRLQLDGDLAGLAAAVFGLEEDVVFRNIVLYL